MRRMTPAYRAAEQRASRMPRASEGPGRPDWGTPETNTMPVRARQTQKSFRAVSRSFKSRGEARVTKMGAV